MTIRLSIGDFSRMTYLSVKALRRYHEMGLLEPALVDPASGYRYDDAAQVPVGQIIRRFRDLGMPLDELKAMLQAPDAATRNELIVSHLRRMEAELARTGQTVAALRALLERPAGPVAVEYRSVDRISALAITEPVAMPAIDNWWSAAFDELHHALSATEAVRTGHRDRAVRHCLAGRRGRRGAVAGYQSGTDQGADRTAPCGCRAIRATPVRPAGDRGDRPAPAGEPAELSGIALDMAGVPEFHRRVYRAARTVPPGSTITYGQLAARIGAPGSARSVGQALGRNPFAIVVPCHRVVAAGGKLGGFSATGGADTKRRMLAIEGVPVDARDGAR